MSPCWMSCQRLGKRLNNKSWTVHPNIAFRREGHRKIQVRDLYLVQMMSQCRATSRKSRHRSLHVAIPNVAGDTSRATRGLSHLTEHKQRNTCVANNGVVAVACRVSRVARNWARLSRVNYCWIKYTFVSQLTHQCRYPGCGPSQARQP